MSIWQTKKWGEMLTESKGADKIYEIDGVFVEKRRVSMGEFGLFVLGVEKTLIESDLEKLVKLCKEENALFLQIETLDYKNSQSQPFLQREKGLEQFKNGFYKKFITPYTVVIDLEKNEEEILALMKPKGRYNIKLASKKGVVVKEVEKTEENIEKYHKLMLETTVRDSFSGHNINYYINFLKTLDNSKLLLAYTDDNNVIAGGIFTFDSKASIYYYGVSTSDKKYRNLMAPYLLQWEAIKVAKSIGSKIYDFLGVATPGEDNSSLAGVTDFKMKLSKDIRKVSDSYIYINKSFKYLLINFLRKIK